MILTSDKQVEDLKSYILTHVQSRTLTFGNLEEKAVIKHVLFMQSDAAVKHL